MKPLLRAAILLLLPLIPAGVSLGIHGHRTPPPAVAADLLQAVRTAERVLWLDARSPEARAARPLPWAMRLADESWEQDLGVVMERWTPGDLVLVFCEGQGCLRGTRAAWRLTDEMGMENVRWIAGGEAEAIALHAERGRP